MATDIDLRSYVYLDSLQPQHAAFLGTVSQGFLPLGGDALLYVEVAPGLEINRLTDIDQPRSRSFHRALEGPRGLPEGAALRISATGPTA